MAGCVERAERRSFGRALHFSLLHCARALAKPLLLTLFFVPGRILLAQTPAQLDSLKRELARQAAQLDSLKQSLRQVAPLQGDTIRLRELVRAIIISEAELTPAEDRLVTLYDEGFVFQGTDDVLRIGGWGQADVPIFAGDHPANSEFVIRRVRLDVRGALERYFSYRVFAEFAGTEGKLQEAWVGYDRYAPARFRIGQFKMPFSLEALMSSLWIDFVEPSMVVANFQPGEDLGVMFFGDLFEKRLEYAFALFNGRGKNRGGNNDAKDVATRIAVKPFLTGSRAKQVYVGASFTSGDQREDFSGRGLASAPRTRWLTFVKDVTFAGNQTRRSVDAEWLVGSSSIKAEWSASRLEGLSLGGNRSDADFHGWYIAATCILTGERKPRNRPVVPRANFDLKAGDWGAWELTLRYDQLSAEDALFTNGFATGTDRARAFTGGINWWPNKHLKNTLNFVHTAFDDPVLVSGKSLDNEDVLLLRFQFNF